MIGFQLYGGEPDNFNNFVLQIGNMIDCSAPRISRKKRELIVYPEQIRNENEYAEVNHNTYCLDFPNRSMTQGWLVFPQKNESLELEGLTTAVDSMLIQVKFDNTLLSNSLARAFDEVGTHRYRTDSTMTAYYHIRQSGYTPCYPYFRIPNLPGVCLHSQSYCRTRCPPHWTIICLSTKRSSNG
nr:type VI secretion system protein TssR domain-containing protein [Bacteroides thetaiotaomicron]